MAMLKLSSPWVIYYHEIKALFEQDPDINIFYDEDANEIKLFVKKASKAEALMQLLPAEKTFGNVTLKVTVVPANDGETSNVDLIAAAFDGNPILSYIHSVHTLFDINYVVFRNEVVQYFSDNIGDVNGMCSTLYQDIAKDVFDECEGVYFCTDTKKSLGAPLGEWP